MRKEPLSLIAGLLAFVAAIAALVFAYAADAPGSRWQAVRTEVPVGKGVRLEVRLIGADAVTVTSTRLDMGPDGMSTMVARLRPAAAPTPGVVAFEADLIMAGRWALAISGIVPGQAEPVSGVVVFTAVEKRSGAAPSPAERRILYYRNPMGLPDVSPAPKKDSMGMDYIPVYADEGMGPDGTLRISPEKVQRAGVRTEPAVRRALARTVRGFGSVVPDESRLAVVTAKFGGFVEEMHVAVTGAEVAAGAPLLRVWIESPEILQKMADFLTALRGGSRAADLDRTERNLRLFGLPDEAIEQIRRSGEAVRSIVLPAPTTGTVLEKPALVGMRFAPGDMLFRTADLSTLWVMAQLAERDLALVKPGLMARLTFKAYPDAPAEGRVAFVYPTLDPATRTAPVRIVLPNPDRTYRTGFYADVAIEAPASDGPVVAIPDSAIIDSGTRRVAFVARGEGRFEPRQLTLGARGGGLVEVREGIAEGEAVVVTGNFLIDAESNLRAALAAFTAPAVAP